MFDKVIALVRDAAPAAASSAVASAVGAAAAAPTWLIAVGQAAVVVVFTVKAIDKRLARLHERVNEAHGRIDAINGRCEGCARRAS